MKEKYLMDPTMKKRVQVPPPPPHLLKFVGCSLKRGVAHGQRVYVYKYH
jgi:hypothetical protein